MLLEFKFGRKCLGRKQQNLIENICIGVSQMLIYESLGKDIKYLFAILATAMNLLIGQEFQITV